MALKDLALWWHHRNTARRFHALYEQEDPYASRTSPFEQDKLGRVAGALSDRRYACGVEIGCGEGALLQQLAPLCERLTGVDLSPKAVSRALEACKAYPGIHGWAGNILTFPWPDGVDLIVAVDTVYYLGQEHSWNTLRALLKAWAGHLVPGGRVCLAHCHNEVTHAKDWLGPHIMKGYREILEEEGMRLSFEHTYTGESEGRTIPYLVSVLEKP